MSRYNVGVLTEIQSEEASEVREVWWAGIADVKYYKDSGNKLYSVIRPTDGTKGEYLALWDGKWICIMPQVHGITEYKHLDGSIQMVPYFRDHQ